MPTSCALRLSRVIADRLRLGDRAAAAHILAMAQALAIVDTEKLRRDEARVRTGFWRKLARHADKVPFLDEALAGYYCAIDRRTPLPAKAVLMAALAYFVLPGDLIPDLIPALGFTDDAAVIYAALRAVGSQITVEHRQRARVVLAGLARP
jgi:uncharacterized membrane protein YkvA (DUF1232 family)